jgi:hypothetical protein
MRRGQGKAGVNKNLLFNTNRLGKIKSGYPQCLNPPGQPLDGAVVHDPRERLARLARILLNSEIIS